MVLAKEAGLLYAAVAMATDYDCWRDSGDKVCVADVLKTFKENVEKITKLFVHIVPKIAAKDWTQEIEELKVSSLLLKIWVIGCNITSNYYYHLCPHK